MAPLWWRDGRFGGTCHPLSASSVTLRTLLSATSRDTSAAAMLRAARGVARYWHAERGDSGVTCVALVPPVDTSTKLVLDSYEAGRVTPGTVAG